MHAASTRTQVHSYCTIGDAGSAHQTVEETIDGDRSRRVFAREMTLQFVCDTLSGRRKESKFFTFRGLLKRS